MCEQTFFLYSHKHRYQKMVEKTRETIFPEIHEYVRAKILGKKSSQKFSIKNFYIHSIIVSKKWWVKMRETIFPETHEWFEQKCWEKKLSPKSAKKVFLHSHEYRN